MGHSRTCNFELQIEREDKSLVIVGAMTKREIIDRFQTLAPLYNSKQGYAWAQTAHGKRLIRNGADYLTLNLIQGETRIYNSFINHSS